MTIRLYFVPDVVDSSDGTERHHAKYFKDRFQAGIPSLEVKHFGFSGVFLVVADVSAAQHTELTGHADVTAVPANLDSTIDGAAERNAVTAALEDLQIPVTNWVQVGQDYRYILRVILHLFLFAKRFYANTGGLTLVGGGLTLGMLVSTIPSATRDHLIQAANELGYDFSNVHSADTYRQALKKIILNREDVSILFGGIEI